MFTRSTEIGSPHDGNLNALGMYYRACSNEQRESYFHSRALSPFEHLDLHSAGFKYLRFRLFFLHHNTSWISIATWAQVHCKIACKQKLQTLNDGSAPSILVRTTPAHLVG